MELFMAASRSGDVEALEHLLVDDVVAWSDGGGVVRAARRPVIGRVVVVRFLSGVARLRGAAVHHAIGVVNGGFGMLVHEAGKLTAVTVPEIAGDRIVAIRSVLNPAKLAHAARRVPRPVTGESPIRGESPRSVREHLVLW